MKSVRVQASTVMGTIHHGLNNTWLPLPVNATVMMIEAPVPSRSTQPGGRNVPNREMTEA